MRRVPVLLSAAVMLAVSSLAEAAPAAPSTPMRAPVADHHQYVYSPAAAAFLSSSAQLEPVTAQDLIAQLDAAGIERAAVLSVAWVYGRPAQLPDDEYDRVRAENDWAARQAGEYPGRLVALCSVDPLKDYALAELARCAASPEFGRGIKLHPAAGVRLDDPAQMARVQRVFRSANARGMAIVLQLRGTSAEGARLLIDQLLPFAPDVPVQVAYAQAPSAGARAGEGATQLAALAVLAEAAARQDPRMRQVWLDASSFARPGLSPADARRVVRRLRQVGMERVLYGSETAVGLEVPPRDAWAAFRSLPLTDAEAARVANNVMPYLR
ncbi:amidohydrolase family protein [Massilia agri]|uniref:Amidohydrolase family protein n=1 Tax=Massilia agri TaxID=1886785 RepID=A0ABT2ANQ9_9BURK|nr:amidohydrolase family protein [Massilia agri]MCS0597853.1 amidohydrolase family protein [Massilia agri]